MTIKEQIRKKNGRPTKHQQRYKNTGKGTVCLKGTYLISYDYNTLHKSFYLLTTNYKRLAKDFFSKYDNQTCPE